jgi:hypothetical protein
MEARNKAIQEVFSTTGPGPGYTTVTQDYKTASILARGKTPVEVAKDLAVLDVKLRDALLTILDVALKDKKLTPEQKAECDKLKKTLERSVRRKEVYRFDYLFGSRSKVVHGSQLDNTFLLITEALKGAGMARCAVKSRRLSGTKVFGKVVPRLPPTPKGQDDRGQPYDKVVHTKVSKAAPALKEFIAQSGSSEANPYFLRRIFVDKVWTDVFVVYRDLLWGNPDVIRDVRKKLLVRPKLREGIQNAFTLQRDLLEIWLTVLNLVDFVSGFLLSEYRDDTLRRYHLNASTMVDELARGDDVRWKALTPIITRDVRQTLPIAILGATSEFQFYAKSSDYPQQIFLTLDIRDLGVDLMLSYELSNDLIGHFKFADNALLAETLRASDHTIKRKRATYDAVLQVFRSYHGIPALRARFAAELAMGTLTEVSGPMPPFEQSVQLMVGGDEIFVAAHPLYAVHLGSIIRDLDLMAFEDQELNLRAGVAFSAAERALVAGPDHGPKIGADQRKKNQIAHHEALTLSSSAPNALKPFERAHRRMERLIEKLEDSADKKKRDLAPGYAKSLDELRLLKMYARAKHGHAKVLPKPVHAALLQALRDEKDERNLLSALDKGAELVDFTGNVVDTKKLTERFSALEAALLKAAGRDNFHVDPPPVQKPPSIPKWVPKWFLEDIDRNFPGLLQDKPPQLPGDRRQRPRTA